MKIPLSLFFATNRNHILEASTDRWRPDRYGKKFSDDGMENLRFGKVTVEADDAKMHKHISEDVKSMGIGNGENLAKYLSKCAESAKIEAYEEKIEKGIADPNPKLGSQAMFTEIQAVMMKSTDILIYIHGFNVDWFAAVGSALALELMLNRSQSADSKQNVKVVLFTWPSDGLALPFVSYKSDRTEAAGSGYAFARGLLKVRDFFAEMRDRAKKGGDKLCCQDIHLLCHSMGNYLLENTVERIDDHTPGNALPRLFEHIFLCAPDVNDNALDIGQPLGRIHELARCVTIYHNRGDAALVISDYTKGNPDRLGAGGAARPSLLHHKLHQVDCTPIVKGEHSYYLIGHTNDDIRRSIDGKLLDDKKRRRVRDPNYPNVWKLK